MTRIEDILKSARYALADPNKERYTDDRLIFALSEAQKDIARQTRLLKAEIDIPLIAGQQEYDLPSDLWMITRAIFNNKRIPLASHDDMDVADLCWFTDYGSKITALVYDKRNMHKVRVYPIPDDSYAIDQYDFVSDEVMPTDSSGLTSAQTLAIQNYIASLAAETTAPLDLTSIYSDAQGILSVVPTVTPGPGIYGVTTSIDTLVATPIYGVLADLQLEQDYSTWPGDVVFNSPYGIMTDLSSTSGVLHLYYIKDPAPVNTVQDELLVSPIFDTALRHFVVGTAYGDDLDTTYQQRSVRALQMYDREISTVGTPTDLTDGTRATQYHSNYTGPFG